MTKHGPSLSASDKATVTVKFQLIWKPIPVRIFYTFVIYQGYDMDILSGKSYDVIYQGYDMDIPNANNTAYPCHIFDFWTNILKCHIRRISKSQIF